MRSVVFTLGRLNPITRGHSVLVKLVENEAKKIGALPMIFIVDGEKSSKDKSKNPLTGAQREYIAKKLFPVIKVDIVSNAYEALEVLYVQGLIPAVWVAGSDRAPKYRKMLLGENPNGVVVEVNRESGEADGVSATAARQAALENDWKTFLSLMPKEADTDFLAMVMKEIREALNVGQFPAPH